MNRNIFKNIQDLSIATKISFGFAIVFFIFGGLSYTSFQNLKKEKENLEKVSIVAENSSRILDINREISEIQRLVNVYSVTGGKSIVEKIKLSYISLSENLYDVKKTTNSAQRVDLLNQLITIIDSYGQNIESLENRYEFRKQLINSKLPEVFNKGERLFSKQVEHFQRSSSVKSAKAQRLMALWYKIYHSANQFLDKKDYRYKQIIKKLFADIRVAARETNYLTSEALKIVNEFEVTFEQAVQANRIYLSLVNVVMAGSAIEFTNISKQLRTSSIKELDDLLLKSDDNFKENKRVMYLGILISIPILMLIGFYYQINIANSIQSISSTFRSFIKGEFDKDIPGLNRNDEIGQLAKAANTFKDVSQKIKQEQARASKLAEIKSKFLATMSHEIRTPMNAVLSCTNLLLSEIKNKEHQKLLRTIKTSGDSLLVLINDILDFSKIESGKINLEKESFDIEECVQSVVDLLDTNASAKGVTLELTSNIKTEHLIRSDITRIRQVLFNLIGNGIKFTHDRVDVHYDVSPVSDNTVKLDFCISDNGIGIKKEAQDSLFEEFSQVDASTTRKYGGTGLGLAICKGIIQAMKGKIWVESEVDKGSKFYFSITTEVAKKPVETERESSTAELCEGCDMNLKILMAEDNSINQIVARRLIEKVGFSIDIVSNGIEAVNAMKDFSYDIIFMDQHMPEMDGVQATKEIRSLNIKQPLIYALTASAFEEDRKRCLEAGMNGFLTKPIVIDQIVSAIKECKS